MTIPQGTGTGPAQLGAVLRRLLLDRSDERDLCLRRIEAHERDGYQRGHADGYESGRLDGIAAYKAAQHDAYRLTADEVARWGPGGRAHFADPRPGDYTGGAVPSW
jgi:hypothetical protein